MVLAGQSHATPPASQYEGLFGPYPGLLAEISSEGWLFSFNEPPKIRYDCHVTYYVVLPGCPRTDRGARPDLTSSAAGWWAIAPPTSSLFCSCFECFVHLFKTVS